jgi:hypothetical protein
MSTINHDKSAINHSGNHSFQDRLRDYPPQNKTASNPQPIPLQAPATTKQPIVLRFTNPDTTPANNP